MLFKLEQAYNILKDVEQQQQKNVLREIFVTYLQ